MTSRQPRTSRAESRGRAGNQGRAGNRGAGSAPDWLLVAPLELLVILGLAGLRGAVARPTWNGPLHQDGVVIGAALEVVLGILLVITIRRRSADLKAESVNAVAVKLCGALILMISVGMVAVAAVVLLSRHLHLFSPRTQKLSGTPAPKAAVESGRSALRTVDDARAAIIACYVAMEDNLAERGAARAIADTPDELLARATKSGIVHGTAAARLTALFYEARFSSHQLGRGQRDAAEQALNELAAGLADPGPAKAAAPGADA